MSPTARGSTSRRLAWSTVIACLLGIGGSNCSTSATPSGNGSESGGAVGGQGGADAGGSGGTGTGGGGLLAAGGATAAGGASAAGGAIATGGATAAGGAVAAGGRTGGAGGRTGGAGGGTGGAGGLGTSGGATGTGGATATGGTVVADAGPHGDAPDAIRADLPAPDGATVDARGLDARVADATVDLPSAGTSCNLAGAATAKTPTVYVIGDSTASVYGESLYPRMGWAQPLQDFFAPACATVADKALSGRSSKSFYDEGNWTPIKSALRAGDYVLIQFGHNDEKTDDAARGTDPFTTFEQYLSIYIDDALAKGATPILLTPINRNNWSGTSLKDTHGDYPVAMRQLAQARKLALVDTTALTKTYFERIGQAATTKLFMVLAAGESPNYPSGNTDNTHLQEKGARIIAQMVLAELYRQLLPPGTLARTPPVAP